MMGSTLENKVDMKRRMKELQSQVDELKDLVNTLLSVICEEPDGVHTGAAPTIPGQDIPNSVCDQPLTTMFGFILTTGRAKPALLVNSITSSTSL